MRGGSRPGRPVSLVVAGWCLAGAVALAGGAGCGPDTSSKDCATLCTALDGIYAGAWEPLFCYPATNAATGQPNWDALASPVCAAGKASTAAGGEHLDKIPMPHFFVDPDYVPEVAAARENYMPTSITDPNDPLRTNAYCKLPVAQRPRYTLAACTATCAEHTNGIAAPGDFSGCVAHEVNAAGLSAKDRCKNLQNCVDALWKLVGSEEL